MAGQLTESFPVLFGSHSDLLEKRSTQSLFIAKPRYTSDLTERRTPVFEMLHRDLDAKRLHPARGSRIELGFELTHECPWTHRRGVREMVYIKFSIQMRSDPDRQLAHSRIFYIFLLRQ